MDISMFHEKGLNVSRRRRNNNKENYAHWRHMNEDIKHGVYDDIQTLIYFELLMETAIARYDRTLDKWMSKNNYKLGDEIPAHFSWYGQEAVAWILAKKNTNLTRQFEGYLQAEHATSCFDKRGDFQKWADNIDKEKLI